MNFSIQRIIRAAFAPNHQISCSISLWRKGLHELRKRGCGCRESGAFLLGTRYKNCCQVNSFIFYDDLEPRCLDSGIVIFSGQGYGRLWEICRESNLEVIADVHTHPDVAIQSRIDKANPMIALQGHIAIIIPNYAEELTPAEKVGIYVYEGAHRWRDVSGRKGKSFLYIGLWG